VLQPRKDRRTGLTEMRLKIIEFTAPISSTRFQHSGVIAVSEPPIFSQPPPCGLCRKMPSATSSLVPPQESLEFLKPTYSIRATPHLIIAHHIIRLESGLRYFARGHNAAGRQISHFGHLSPCWAYMKNRALISQHSHPLIKPRFAQNPIYRHPPEPKSPKFKRAF
jgi:hypothetical protein